MSVYIRPGTYYACPSCGMPWADRRPVVLRAGDTLRHPANQWRAPTFTVASRQRTERTTCPEMRVGNRVAYLAAWARSRWLTRAYRKDLRKGRA